MNFDEVYSPAFEQVNPADMCDWRNHVKVDDKNNWHLYAKNMQHLIYQRALSRAMSHCGQT